jgi:hypothetical protein
MIGFGVAAVQAIRYDRWVREMESLDDEELAAVLAEFPDIFDRKAWNQ